MECQCVLPGTNVWGEEGARGGGAAGKVDLTYRVYAYSVPIAASEQAHFVDEIASGGGYTIPADSLFSQSAAIINA